MKNPDKWTYSCSANIFPVAKPMIPPPTAANIPSLRPVRAIAGVPRQVATNSAVAMGTWLFPPPFSCLSPWVSVVPKLSVLSMDCWLGKLLPLADFGFAGDSVVDSRDNLELPIDGCEESSGMLEVEGKLRNPTDAVLFLVSCQVWQELISQMLISQELLSRAFSFEHNFIAGFPLSSSWTWDLFMGYETKVWQKGKKYIL